jgi:Centrosomin N-terminal motif 1
MSYDFGPSAQNGILVRDEQEDRQRLEKENFDLKMKMYYMESAMKRSGEASDGSAVSTLISTKIDFARQLEEKNFELDQRNQLLARAKNAIEALKGELEKQRVDGKRKKDELEEQLRYSRKANDELVLKYHEKAMALDEQLARANDVIMKKDQQLADIATQQVNTTSIWLQSYWLWSFISLNL